MDLGPIFTIDTSSTIPVYFLQSTITFHTIHLTLCFQQTDEIGNLTVRWGKVLSLCCAGFHVASNTFESFPSSYWFDNLGFLLRENLLQCSSHLPLGVSQRSFHAPSRLSSTVEGEAKDGFTRGVLHNISLYFVFVLLSFFCLVLFASFYQKHQKMFGLLSRIKNTQKIVPTLVVTLH